MQVLVDTSVWSLALRRGSTIKLKDSEIQAVELLRDLIADSRATMIGAIRQELLSGIKHAEQFDKLRQALSGFEDLSLTSADFETAAEYFNTCRKNGIAGSNTDFLICAAASLRQLPILTRDQDFERFSKHVPIHLL
jgi:predicted nucleic acid-binding protein